MGSAVLVSQFAVLRWLIDANGTHIAKLSLGGQLSQSKYLCLLNRGIATFLHAVNRVWCDLVFIFTQPSQQY